MGLFVVKLWKTPFDKYTVHMRIKEQSVRHFSGFRCSDGTMIYSGTNPAIGWPDSLPFCVFTRGYSETHDYSIVTASSLKPIQSLEQIKRAFDEINEKGVSYDKD